MDLNASVGYRIAKLRKENHLTQEQLAEKLDISIKHCSSVERGLSSLSLEKLIDVSNLFDVSLDYLIKCISVNSESVNIILSYLPQSITSILDSENEEEIQLFKDYLYIF